MTTGAGRLLLAACGLAALTCMAVGLLKLVYFEPTATALRSARTGGLLIALAGAVLLGVALAARSSGAPRWVGLALALPAVLCGGLALLADGTLLPQLVALPAIALGLAGLVGLVLRRGQAHLSARCPPRVP